MVEIAPGPGKRTNLPSTHQYPGWLVPVSFRLPAVRPKRQNEPPSPTNYSNFVHEQNDYGHQRDPDGQRVASKEVQSHACPAEACSY